MYLYSFSYWTAYDIYVELLRVLINIAICMSLVVSVDRLLHVAEYVYLKLKSKRFGKGPEQTLKSRPLPDPLHFSIHYPTVAVQLPMFNEKAVCQAVIEYASKIEWPRDRFCIQVLDDSTDPVTRQLVDDKCLECQERGINCYTLRRTNRKGYKAGALKDGLAQLKDYEYIAVFDADFRPDPDFLYRMVPYIHNNPEVGYIQARWTFSNPDETLLTRAQEINLNFHMKCEQWTHFATGAFFNFNGTAGIWRRACIEDVGGWNARTTVEDMDLSLRAYLAGWRGVFLSDVCVGSELPASFFAYRKQQHRWTCGPVQLWFKAWTDISYSKIPPFNKVQLNLCYFGVRKVASHIVNLGFFCVLVPLSVFTPEVSIPLWALVYLPITVALCTAIFTPAGWYYCVIYILFENAMGLVKNFAVLAGWLGLKRAQEWVVTTKQNSSSSQGVKGTPQKGNSATASHAKCRFYVMETLMSVFVLTAAFYSAMYVGRITFSIFLLMQGSVFLAFGLNLIDQDGLLGNKLSQSSLFSK
eukprot:TRINITY_DN2505_c0_g1_i1.p1 TRINITY_DN2505_c0_g1~~TRINITY_DN2505_c0_g1_i1.p1  ORF type:complete len:527 (-),score=49.87 TRINITY_DN2505_c0_g1_i1:2452-4032(-)